MAGGVTYNKERKGVGDMLYFAVALDDEKIRRDGIINTEGAYKCITDTFAARGVVLLKTVCGIRYYTRDIDKHDFEALIFIGCSNIGSFVFIIQINCTICKVCRI